MTQEIPNADMVSIELAELWHAVERAALDGIVTKEERQELHARYVPLQKKARDGAVMQKAGIRFIRMGRCDKNLLTELRLICEDEGQEKAPKRRQPLDAYGAA